MEKCNAEESCNGVQENTAIQRDEIMKEKLTTLCYIEKDGCYLMMHRISKEKDVNKNKWIGVGGHFETGESPEECLLREVKEETGLTLTAFRFRGIITFSTDTFETEYMCLYTADGFEGELTECNEGILKWIPKDEIWDLNLWEGDRIFLKMLLEDAPFFSMKLQYVGESLSRVLIDGQDRTPGESAKQGEL